MKRLLLVSLCCLLFLSCENDRYVFTMKSIKLNSYHKSEYPEQNLSLKVVELQDTHSVLASTDSYPSNLTLPATFAINSPLHLHLYKDNIGIELWGDSTGFIASSEISMSEYKIIFPIDMETENDSVSFSVRGSWK